MLTEDQAMSKLKSMLDNPNLIKHCLAVQAAMLYYADYFEVTPEEKILWGIAGLIHDADWEKYPDDHPQIIVKWLQDQNASDEVINAVASHGFAWSEQPKSLMAHTIRAVDELTGLITAVALVKGRSLANVTVESVMKKIPETKFASGVNRQDIIDGAKEINLPLEVHISNVLKAMQSISDTLDL